MSRAVKLSTKAENGISYDVYECYVGDDPEKSIKGERVEYSVPTTPGDFLKMAQSATPQGLEQILDSYIYGWGLKARSAARPGGGGVTLPVVSTKKWGKLNLVTGEFDGGTVKWEGKALPLQNRVAMLNAAVAMAASKDEPAPRAVAKAIEELVTGKKATSRDGVLKIAG